MEKKYEVIVNHVWCKSCGICVGFCPAKILSISTSGKHEVDLEGTCIGCKMCELRCPDFAIRIEEVTKND